MDDSNFILVSFGQVECKGTVNPFMRMSNAGQNFMIFFLKNSQNFPYHIWIQHEKCIQMDTNAPDKHA